MEEILVIGGNGFLDAALGSVLSGRGAKVRRVHAGRDSEWPAPHEGFGMVYDLTDPTDEVLLESALTWKGRAGRYVVARDFSHSLRRGRVLEKGAGGAVAERELVSRREEEALEQLPVTLLHLPFVFGPGEPRGILEYHVRRAMRHDPLYFPNMFAHISVAHVDDVAKALADLPILPPGAWNVAAEEPLLLGAFCDLLAETLDVTLDLTRGLEDESAEAYSPLGVTAPFVFDVHRIRGAGLSCRAPMAWLFNEILAARKSLSN